MRLHPNLMRHTFKNTSHTPGSLPQLYFLFTKRGFLWRLIWLNKRTSEPQRQPGIWSHNKISNHWNYCKCSRIKRNIKLGISFSWYPHCSILQQDPNYFIEKRSSSYLPLLWEPTVRDSVYLQGKCASCFLFK